MNLYTRYEALSPIYQGGLTNHLPMMLVILEKWGISEEDIESLLDTYYTEKGVYNLTNTALPITEFEKNYIHLTSYYLHEFRVSNVNEVVTKFLSKHKDSFPSSLFHGLIRLYYSLQNDYELQIAQALAHFDLVASDYKIEGNIVEYDQILHSIEKAREEFIASGITLRTESTTEKYVELVSNESIRKLIVTSKNRAVTKKEILDILLTRYLETNDFYILHLITGFHALIGLDKYNLNKEYTLKQFFMNAQVFLMFNPNKNIIDTSQLLSKEELYDKRSLLKDAHDIKLFSAVLDLTEEFSNPKLLMVANRVLFDAINNLKKHYDGIE